MLNACNIYTNELHALVVQVWKNPHVLKFAEQNYTSCYISEGVMKLVQNIEQLEPDSFLPNFDMIKYCRLRTAEISELRIPCDKYQTMVKCYDGMNCDLVTQ